ncbi:MAG: UDP-N-acetylglucosamine 2-epimerase (non-hydrolyzing) [Desulfobacteraceae bacterium]|nr:UDP-N-acetylglucosamine 2-epimerase (non-hydrolyzing) [Desulfobacteraceae bacterium]
MKIISVVGARPNFMKIAPFIRAIKEYNRSNENQLDHLLVHTGQHYDDKMSKAFFKALDIPDADINLNVGSGTHAEQVGRTMIEFEKVLQKEKPDWVVVVGDVNATCACSITAKKEHVKCAHIEAGLRSRDMTMPEEINRLVTDRLSDLLFTPDRLSGDNLRQEGVPENQIKFVGNIMIDTLEAQRKKAEALNPVAIVETNTKSGQAKLSDAQKENLINGNFATMTLHRPSNVDDKKIFAGIIDFLINQVSEDMPLLWPAHPRAVKQMQDFGLWDRVLQTKNLLILHPLNYHDLLRLNMGARIMLTDSGGLQEECCVLGTPCLTLRWNTERPVTLREHGGASVLVGNDIEKIKAEYKKTMALDRTPTRPELWDGKTAPRIVQAIVERQ